MSKRGTNNSGSHCRIRERTTAWALGTGLQVGLEPGEYRVTDVADLDGVTFLRLDDRYHCPAEACDLTLS